MNNPYQPQPGQYSHAQNIQHIHSPGGDGQGTTHGNRQILGPQGQAATFASASSTTTTTTSQQYTVTPNHQHAPGTYPLPNLQLTSSGSSSTGQLQHMQQQQPSPYLSIQQPTVQPGHNAMHVPYQQLYPSGTHNTAQSQYVRQQQQQQFTTPQPQMPHQQAVHQLQSHDTVMSPQPLMLPSTDQLSTSVGTPTAQVYQQPQISQHPPVFQQPPLNSPVILEQPQQSSSVNYTQLWQPQQATGSNYSQLMQAAPTTDTSSSAMTTTTTATRTETYKGANAGGEARKQAETRGNGEVQRFEQRVQKLIKSIGTCPSGAPWYNGVDGYLCAEGIHFLYHKDIDKAFKQPGWIPRVTWVNTLIDPEATSSGQYHITHPPPTAFDQPMHRVHRLFMSTVRRMGIFVLRGIELEGLRKKGCNDECLRGLETQSVEETDRHLRWQGYDPNATRHAMFRDH